MKKVIISALVLMFVSLAGCDEESNADLSIINKLGEDIKMFKLTGEESTGNLLSQLNIAVLADNEQVATPFEDLLPGKYKWHIEYVDGSLIQAYDHPTEIELFPGSNHLVLTQGL